MSDQIDYLNDIIADIREDCGSLYETNSSLIEESVAFSIASSAATNIATDAIQYPLDPEVKKIIQKKVKLEMKLKKIKRECPKNKELINEYKNELKEVEKLYRLALSIAKSDKTKDIVKQYTKKCEVDYGPRSIYYASIKVPELKKESARNSLLEDLDLDFYIESEMEEVIMTLEETLNANVTPENPPENDDSGAVTTDNTSASKSSPEKNENCIGTMLPQTGSTDGLGNPNDVIEDINKVNKNADDLNGIDLPDDIELEGVSEYILNSSYNYSYFVENEIIRYAKKVKTNIALSIDAKKLAMDKAIANAKLYVAKKMKVEKPQIDELKRNVIEKEKKFREGCKKLSIKEKAEIKALERKLEIEFRENIIKEKIYTNIEKDKKPLETTDKPVEENYEPYDLKYPKDILQIKLEAAQEAGNLELINKYNNQIKYYDLNPDANIILINEAANIDPEIKAVIEVLNDKGYKTKYSSAGHTHLRKKEDEDTNGVYYDKLYSDARIMFDDDYKFPPAPKYWVWKTVDDKDYLDIVPIRYNPDKDGSPDKAFAKWKVNYMGTLRTWVDNLPDRVKSEKDTVKTKDRKGRDITVESVDELMSDINFKCNVFIDDIFDK